MPRVSSLLPGAPLAGGHPLSLDGLKSLKEQVRQIAIAAGVGSTRLCLL